jgi:hypothetical protein
MKSTTRRLALFLAVTGLFSTTATLAWAEGSDPDTLETVLEHTTVTLQHGLKASEREGKPISGKFETESDALQLSVYTLKGGRFSEVVADPKTGAVAEVEKITDPDDLKAAAEQKAAMEKATISLTAAADAAMNANHRPASRQHLPAIARWPSSGRGDPARHG